MEDGKELCLKALPTEFYSESSVGLSAVGAGSSLELLLRVSLLLLVVEIDC